MVSFTQSNTAIMGVLLASAATSDAAYGRYFVGSRPTRELGSRMMLPTHRGRQSLVSQDIQRVLHDFDEMFSTVLGGADEVFYEPFQLQRRNRPSYLLQGPTQLLNNLAATSKTKNASGITQDEKQLQIVVDVPGATANDIHLQLEDDGHLLKISGETKREEGGISVHSRFDRAFTLNRDVDTSKISAQMDNGVLTITAPKFEKAKETARRIDIVENKQNESPGVTEQEEVVASVSQEKRDESQEAKPEVDESVIDLDESTE